MQLKGKTQTVWMFGGKGYSFHCLFPEHYFPCGEKLRSLKWTGLLCIGGKELNSVWFDETHQARVPRCWKAEGRTGIEDRPLMSVTEPSCSARALGLHLWLWFKAWFRWMCCCLAALMFVQVFRLILVECLSPKNSSLHRIQEEFGLYCSCFVL